MAAKKSRHGILTEKRAEMRFGVIKQIEVVSATPAEVYQAYVDPKKHAAFTGTETTGTPKVGGKFTAGDGYTNGNTST